MTELESLAVEIANFAERRRNEVFVPLYGHEYVRPRPSIALLFAFAHQRRVESDRDTADYAKGNERVVALAKRLCVANKNDPDALVQGLASPPTVHNVGLLGAKIALADAVLLAGTSKPLWMYYLQTATQLITLVDGDDPSAAAPLQPEPPKPIMVEP